MVSRVGVGQHGQTPAQPKLRGNQPLPPHTSLSKPTKRLFLCIARKPTRRHALPAVHFSGLDHRCDMVGLPKGKSPHWRHQRPLCQFTSAHVANQLPSQRFAPVGHEHSKLHTQPSLAKTTWSGSRKARRAKDGCFLYFLYNPSINLPSKI